MANEYWDSLADKTSDTSIGDTKGLKDKAAKDAAEAMGTQTNEQWGNSSSHGGTPGHTVADKGDYSANVSYNR